MRWWAWTALGVGAYWAYFSVSENLERWRSYRLSRAYCDRVGKKLLRIGMQRAPWEPPGGDVTLDLDPDVLKVPGGIQGDERQMPFADKQFGVCFNEHTLEHLPDVESIRRAVAECVRVADYAVFLIPSPWSPSNFLWKTHYHRILVDGGVLRVRDNDLQLPVTIQFADASMEKTAGVGQVLIAAGRPPEVLAWE